MQASDLTDVWRVVHPQERWFTSFTKSTALSCIDLFLASPSFLVHVSDSYIGNAFRSDHSPIWLKFSFDAEARGPGVWHFPNFLLGDPQYITHITDLIQELKSHNAEAEPTVLWDTIKACVQGENY